MICAVSSVVEMEVYRVLMSYELCELVGKIVKHIAAVTVAFPRLFFMEVSQ